ncbi:hypothetical protein [Sporosarcina cascadiensis]|uniref:hypothetical protein n=1 Tax=Sporosarcina cascadiensis TaxID=2660747 RepID=UPI00129ABE0B|nr:hypothetical protein [Sporosarcina cascadiensis]
MNKFWKVSLSTVLVATALTPIAVTEAAANTKIAEVVFAKQGKPISISKNIYDDAFMVGFLKGEKVSHLRLNNERYYEKSFYDEAIVAAGSIDAALQLLTNSNVHTTLSPEPGEFENGKLVTSCGDTEFNICSID